MFGTDGNCISKLSSEHLALSEQLLLKLLPNKCSDFDISPFFVLNGEAKARCKRDKRLKVVIPSESQCTLIGLNKAKDHRHYLS